MRKIYIIGVICFLLMAGGQKAKAQFYAVSTDVLGLATTTLNVGVSTAVDLKWSLHLPVQFNPWSFADNKKLKQLTLQPGGRYWIDQTYGYGWFVGANAVVSWFNTGGLFGSDYRYEGMAYGAGLSGGFSLPLTRLWNLEMEVGAGAAYVKHDKYECVRCGDKLEDNVEGVRFVPTKLSVNLVYLF